MRDAWRAEMKRQRDELNIDIATAQTLFVTYAETFIRSLRKQKPSTIESYRDLLEYYFLDFVDRRRNPAPRSPAHRRHPRRRKWDGG
jgi:hypothetical protein